MSSGFEVAPGINISVTLGWFNFKLKLFIDSVVFGLLAEELA